MLRVVSTIAKVAALIAVAAVLLVLLATGFVDGLIWLSGLFGVQHSLGIDTQMSKNYDSVSGYLPIIVTSLGFSGVLVTAWHHLNCHVEGCPRIGRFPVAGGAYKVCKKDHRRIVQAQPEKLTAEHLRRIHEEHVG